MPSIKTIITTSLLLLGLTTASPFPEDTEEEHFLRRRLVFDPNNAGNSAVAQAVPLNRTGWTVTADSFQTGNEAAKVLDGSTTTIWHTAYSPNVAALPHNIVVDMKKAYWINGVSLLPRQDGSGNGRIGQHKIEVSLDGTSWGTPVAIGTYLNDASLKLTIFGAVSARYVRVTAITEAQSASNQWTSIAELNVLSGPDPILPRDSWVVTVDSQQDSAHGAAAAVDGDQFSIWHTQYSPSVAPFPHTFTIDQGSAKSVSGLSYLPRPPLSGPEAGTNGRIGQYQVASSIDGNTWTTLTSGTFSDDGNAKTVTFTPKSARYFRLTALSEAGNRGTWTSAAEINLHDGSRSQYPPPSPKDAGQWSGTIDFPIVPAAAALVPLTGKVVTWSSYAATQFGGSPGGITLTATYDPVSQTVSQRSVSNTNHDMFCPGISMDFNGRPIVTGGNDAAKTSIYNPLTDAWLAGANMKISRGYQATATCSDGRIFNLGGSWSGGQGGKNGEIYNPTANTWTLLPGCPVQNMLTADTGGVYRADNHGWFFGWKNGFVFHAGPSKAMNWYGTQGSGSVKFSANRANDGDSMNGNAVMYDAANGKIVTMGGGPDYQAKAATSNAHLIAIGAPNATATATQLSSMAFARAFANAVVLPNGKVFVTGGQSWPEPFTDNTAVYYPELWDPATQTFTEMAPNAVPRTYHSVALLLMDGTVFAGGGGLCGTCATNHFDAEIFSPPYLFNIDGTKATRPKITSVTPTTSGNVEVVIGGTLTVKTDSAVTAFSLVRMGSATHTVDTDQRRVALTPTSAGTNTYTLTVPSDAGIALPGYWMLFALNSAGTPSVAVTVKVKLS